jgi:hypothetical protein
VAIGLTIADCHPHRLTYGLRSACAAPDAIATYKMQKTAKLKT